MLRDDALLHMLNDLAHVERDDKPAPQVLLVERRWSDLNLAGGKDSRPLKSIARIEKENKKHSHRNVCLLTRLLMGDPNSIYD